MGNEPTSPDKATNKLVTNTYVPFGKGPKLRVTSLHETPYLALSDTNGASLLTLAIAVHDGEPVFTVHLAKGVKLGDPL